MAFPRTFLQLFQLLGQVCVRVCFKNVMKGPDLCRISVPPRSEARVAVHPCGPQLACVGSSCSHSPLLYIQLPFQLSAPWTVSPSFRPEHGGLTASQPSQLYEVKSLLKNIYIYLYRYIYLYLPIEKYLISVDRDRYMIYLYIRYIWNIWYISIYHIYDIYDIYRYIDL